MTEILHLFMEKSGDTVPLAQKVGWGWGTGTLLNYTSVLCVSTLYTTSFEVFHERSVASIARETTSTKISE